MKKLMKLAAFAAAAATLLVACNKEKDAPAPVPTDGTVMKVTIPDALTKVSFTDQTASDAGMALAWEAGDAIRVISGSTSESFAIKEGFSGHVAEFTGNAVSGSSFNVIYPGTFETLESALAHDYAGQTQTGNGSTAHLKYNAALVGVDTYEQVAFIPDWATTHGGTLYQNGVLKLVVTLPEGVSAVTRAALSAESEIFVTDNAGAKKALELAVALENVDVSADGGVLTAYMNIPAVEQAIPAGTTLAVNVTGADGTEYTKAFEVAQDVKLQGGKLNTVRLTAEGPEILSDYYVSVSGAGEKSGKDWNNAMDVNQFKEMVSTVVIPSTSEESTADDIAAAADAQALSDANAALLDGVTFHFADGTYVLPDEENPGGLKIEYHGYSKQVALTFEGSDKAILSGDQSYRVLILGNQVDLTIQGMTVADGRGKGFNDAGEVVDQEGAGILVAAGGSGDATLNLFNTIFSSNQTASSTSGGAIRCAKGTVNAEGCVFDADNYARNGASIYTNNDNAVVNCKSCTFKSHSNNTGGAANNSKGAQHYVGCEFIGCYTEIGTGGAIHCNAAGAVVTVEDCLFSNCRVCVNEIAKETTSKSTGIISLQKGDFTVTGSTFDGCEGISGAVILLQSDDSGIFKCSDCVFTNNEGKSRGIIQTNGKSVGFFNNCLFYNNKMTTKDWGLILHGGNPSAACFNNCTIIGNYRDANGGNCVCLNNDGSIILTNSTVIERDDLVSVRNTKADNSGVLLANSIVINTASGKGFIDAVDKMKATANSYNSILGPSYLSGSTYTTHNDILTATEATLTGGAYDAAAGVYKWSGPAGTFTKMTPAAFETAVKGVTANNGNKMTNAQLGTAFYAWLTEIGAVGKDALGTARGDAWWPGAYQN